MKSVCKSVDKHRQLILDAEQYIWQNPETGYKEFKTSAYLENAFAALGYDLVKADGITGFYTVLDTGREGPEVLVLAELDSILCPTHPNADPETGAVHSCGHHAQCAALLGLAAALKEDGVLDGLCGRIRLCAVPAEELLEIDYRLQLKAQNKIRYLGGKSEFLSRGYFDGVDLALMVHTSAQSGVRPGSVGCLTKKIIYKGTSAHAGGAPWDGRNALYAATGGINAINAIRETFKDTDNIRVHPIITEGGNMVNAIPETVTLESYVRGRSFEAIVDANKKMNRALVGAALSIGTNVEIVDTAGYSPLRNDPSMMQMAVEAYALACDGETLMVYEQVSTGSTDMGDLSCLMPVVHPYIGGAMGKSHGSDYRIADVERACVCSAKWQLAMLSLLLDNGAERANRIIAEYQPMFADKEAFLAFCESLQDSGDRIVYHEDGTATARLD
jgi:amidohydrolase